MLRQRIISAIFMLLVFLLINFYVGEKLFAVAMSVLAAFAGWEWSRLSGVRNTVIQVACGLVVALVSIGLVIILPSRESAPLLVKALVACVALFWLVVACLFYLRPVKKEITGQVDSPIDWGSMLTGLFLLGACVYFSHLLHAQSLGGSPLLFVYAMCTVWVMDVGAYFVGKRFGKNKLAPKISPGKTWEGVAGGLICAFVFAFVVLQLVGFASGDRFAIVIGTVLAAAASILGDLYESRLKRAVGFKDSSQLIPGHGGVLDRIDGVIAAIPVFAFAWIWL